MGPSTVGKPVTPRGDAPDDEGGAKAGDPGLILDGIKCGLWIILLLAWSGVGEYAGLRLGLPIIRLFL